VARRRSVALVVAPVLAASAAAFAINAGGSHSQAHAAASADQVAATAAFAPFRRVQSTADRAPSGVFPGDVVTGTVSTNTMRALSTRHPGYSMWAELGAKVCVAGGGPFENVIVSACSAPENAAADGVFVLSHPAPAVVKEQGLAAGTVNVFAMLPDGASHVQATTASGQESLPIEDNAITATLSSWPESITFVDRSGQTHKQSFPRN
jgi:hypothetical protein